MTDSPQQPQTSTFYIDPDYADFVPGKTELKFSALYDRASPREILLILLITVPLAVLSIAMAVVPVYEVWFTGNPETEAVIADCQIEYHKTAYLRLTYIYQVESLDGERRSFTSNGAISKASHECTDIPPGIIITIKYNPDLPVITRIIEGEPFGAIEFPVFPYLFGFLVDVTCSEFIIGVVRKMVNALVEYIKANRNYPPLLQAKAVIDGTIDSIKRQELLFIGRSGNPETKHRVRVSYTFTSPDGTSHTGVKRFYCHEGRLPNLPTVGTPVKILYAADNCHVML